MTTERVRAAAIRHHDRALIGAVLMVAAAAWIALVFLPGAHQQHSGPTSAGHHQHGHEHALAAGALSQALLWYAGWALMVVAMMLPPAVPMLRMMRRIGAQRGRPTTALAASAAGFVLVWLSAGLVLLYAAMALSRFVALSDWLSARPQLLSGTVAVTAGLYQVTPLKRTCLTACRSPFSIAATTLTGTRPLPREAARVGLRFGAICVGCCGALMVLGLTVGAFALPLMVLLAVVMAAERLLPRTRPFVPLVALGAVALGVLLLTGVLPPGLG